MSTTLLSLFVIASTPATPLSAERPIADLGQVIAGKRLTATFEIRHAAEHGRILIRSVNGSCGCAGGELDQRELAPGESCRVKATVFTAGQPSGPNRWRLSVRYSYTPGLGQEPHDGVLPLEIEADLTRLLEIEPAELRLEIPANQDSAAAVTRSIRLASHSDKPIGVAEVKSSTGRIVVAKGTADKTVELTIAAAWGPGEHREMVLIRTDDPNHPEVAVPVTVSARETHPIQCSPSLVIFQRVATGGPASRLVQIRARDGSPVKIRDCACDDPNVRLVWPEGTYAVGTIRIKVVDASKIKPGRAEVRVSLDSPAGESLVIPLDMRTP